MAEFHIKIAGCVASVRSLFDSTPQYFRAYRTEEAADFSVAVQPEDLRFEQAELDAEAAQEGFRRRQFTDPFLERTAIQRAFAEYLLAQNVLLVHGSAVAADGKGYLFLARSGTGKSTHTRLWREMLGQRAQMINDDKPFLAIGAEGVTIYGSPWSGKHGLDTNVAVPLAGICLLERGETDQIWPITAEEILPMLAKQTYQSLDASEAGHTAVLVEQLAQLVPLWRMHCTPRSAAAQLAFQTMAK